MSARSWTRDLLSGLAELHAQHGVGVWNPDGVYAGDQVALTIGGLPPSPDNAICFAVYGAGTWTDSVTDADAMVQVQARMRGGQDPRVVDDLADGVYDVLQGLSNCQLATGVFVLLAQRRIVAPLDRDASGRWERADSYDLMVARPSLHRP
ncbi:minor capsid protein [Nonomuraea sp. NPDC050394]|uniref:minor capsid protein n=1 Tax=Nonomuraea sp. NPDC050394 TaxID=3364363 RepID=UPI0037B0B06A